MVIFECQGCLGFFLYANPPYKKRPRVVGWVGESELPISLPNALGFIVEIKSKGG
jgi:hypothetical protein